jgi:Tfp pilus assembly protein PilW
MSARGYTVLELLIACALLLVVAGAMAAMVTPVRDAFERSIGAADLAGGSRAVIEQLSSDIREAGSGASVGAPDARVTDVLASIVPLADLDAPGAGARNQAVRLTRVPRFAAQGALRVPAAAGDTVLELRSDAQCTATGVACGFAAGTVAIVYDATGVASVTVASIAAGLVRLTAGLPLPFGAGAAVAAVEVTSYGVRDELDGTQRLVRATRLIEQPLLENVVGFEVTTSGPDARRVERVDIALRVQSPSASLRGPAGRLFRRAGNAARPSQWVPDVETRISIAPRNQS